MQPQDTISYWLSYAQRYVGSAFFEVLEAHCVERGKAYVITPPQWGMMALVSVNGEQTVSALAQHLGVDAPAITAFVRRLEQSGLVERVHDREDRRVVKVYLTPEGQDIIRSLDPVVAAFNERIVPRDQWQAFFEQLQQLIATVETVAPGAKSRFSLFKKHMLQKEHEHEDE
jgi:DNA-binding MarR family transcriptional regulator